MIKPNFPNFDALYDERRICNPLRAEWNDYINLVKSGMIREHAGN